MSKPCELSHDAARLRDAFEELAESWQQTTTSWNDDVSRRFAEHYLDPLGPALKTTLDAVGRMTQLMQQMIHECER